MLSHIISRIVLDMTCPVCNGMSNYKIGQSAKPETIVCKNCNGKGRTYELENTVLLVPNVDMIEAGVRQTMALVNVFPIENDIQDAYRMAGVTIQRLYVYNVSTDSETFQYLMSRLQSIRKDSGCEVHMYYD